MRVKKGSRRSTTNKRLEQIFVILLLMLASVWIIMTVGVVIYHKYYRKSSHLSAKVLPGLGRSPAEPKQVESNTVHRPSTASGAYESPLIIFTCKRDNYLRETLDDILKYIPKDCSMGCPVVVSQDGNTVAVKAVIEEYQTRFEADNIPLVRIEHSSSLRGRNAYQALAIHYGWALGQVFDGTATPNLPLPQRVVILEEDIHVAPDFFSYFSATAPLLDSDRTLLAVSAFNDNGYDKRVKEPTRVLRSDFFPGLGWMMTRKLWANELKVKWPEGYWDDWLREPAQSQSRQVLRPEISRTYHFGFKGGASGNQFGDRISKVFLNTVPVDWTKEDLSYLQDDVFLKSYGNIVSAAHEVSSIPQALEQSETRDVRMEYTSLKQFALLARQLELMEDEKAGIPRTAYKGVVETRPHGEHFVFLTPPMSQLEKTFGLEAET